MPGADERIFACDEKRTGTSTPTSENADGNLVAPGNSENVDSYYLFGRRFLYRSALYSSGKITEELGLIGGGTTGGSCRCNH
jgi:hypothetical protein